MSVQPDESGKSIVPDEERSTSLEPSPLEALVERYENNPVIQALAGLLIGLTGPFGATLSALERAIQAKVIQMHQERLRTFFDELASGRIKLTEEVIQQEDFLHAFMATTRAVLRTRREEKIRLFARLLASFGQETDRISVDNFEDSLNILDDLSCREFFVLLTLKKYEEQTPFLEGENELQRASRFWNQFTSEVCAKLGISTEELRGMLARLNRTGLYKTFTGAFFDYRGGMGTTTPNLDRLLKLFSEPPGDLLKGVGNGDNRAA